MDRLFSILKKMFKRLLMVFIGVIIISILEVLIIVGGNYIAPGKVWQDVTAFDAVIFAILAVVIWVLWEEAEKYITNKREKRFK